MVSCESSGSDKTQVMHLPVFPFYDHFEDAIAAGIKTATTRSKKYGEVGSRFRTPRGTVIEIVYLQRRTLEDVAYNLWREEGVSSPAEFIEVWRQIHPRRGYRPDDVRWVHHFKRVPRQKGDLVEDDR